MYQSTQNLRIGSPLIERTFSPSATCNEDKRNRSESVFVMQHRTLACHTMKQDGTQSARDVSHYYDDHHGPEGCGHLILRDMPKAVDSACAGER